MVWVEELAPVISTIVAPGTLIAEIADPTVPKEAGAPKDACCWLIEATVS